MLPANEVRIHRNRPHSFFVAQPLWKECTDCMYWLNTTLQAGWPDYDSSIHDNCQIEPWVKKNTETSPQRGEPQRWLSVEGVLFHWHHDLKSPFHFPTVTACWFQRWLCVPKWSGSFLVHFSSAAAATYSLRTDSAKQGSLSPPSSVSPAAGLTLQ